MKKLLLTTTLALALTFTLGCEEKKSADKAKDGTEPVAEAVTEPAKVEEAAKQVTSCKAGEKVKLLESTTNDGGELKFEYDNQNRIVKIYEYSDGKISSTKTIIYSSDDFITVDTKKLVKKGNIISIESDALTLNKEG